MADRPLNECFDTSGHWYVPEAPQQVIAGSLHYTPDQTELHLDGTFRQLRGIISAGDDIQTYPIVHGVTKKGEAVTLLNAQRSGYSVNFQSGGLRQSERLISTVLLIGAHVPANFAFPKVSFRVPSLQVWHARKTIDETFERDAASSSSTLSYRIQRPAKEAIRVAAINTNLEWHLGLHWNADPFTSVAVSVSAWVTFHPDSPQSLTWYLEQYIKLATMLAFIAGAPMSPDCIDASIDESPHQVYVMVALPDVSYCTHNNRHQFFLDRGTMGIELENVVARWFEVYDSIRMPSRLALSIFASQKMWLHVEFLSLMQALEGFHRRLFAGNYMDETEFVKVKNVLEKAIPTELGADHKAALRARIGYGNEISLRQRLHALADMIPEQIRASIFGVAGKVPQQWIDTRNYYTHWDEELRARVLDGQDMYYANGRMRHFLRILYLQLMGIPEDALAKSITNASEISQHLVQINAVERRRRDPNDKSGVIMVVTEQQASKEAKSGPESPGAGPSM